MAFVGSIETKWNDIMLAKMKFTSITMNVFVGVLVGLTVGFTTVIVSFIPLWLAITRGKWDENLLECMLF